MPKYQGKKSRGSHTTFLDTSWATKLVRKVRKEATVRGINPGPITRLSGKTKSDYLAKEIPSGIELTIFGSSQKQLVIIYTTCAEHTAKALDLTLKV